MHLRRGHLLAVLPTAATLAGPAGASSATVSGRVFHNNNTNGTLDTDATSGAVDAGAIANLLSAETIDNTTALAAEQVRHRRAAPIAGRPVDRYDLGRDAATTLWLTHDSGILRRVHTDRIPGGLTIDLLTHAPVAIHLPPDRDRDA